METVIKSNPAYSMISLCKELRKLLEFFFPLILLFPIIFCPFLIVNTPHSHVCVYVCLRISQKPTMNFAQKKTSQLLMSTQWNLLINKHKHRCVLYENHIYRYSLVCERKKNSFDSNSNDDDDDVRGISAVSKYVETFFPMPIIIVEW